LNDAKKNLESNFGEKNMDWNKTADEISNWIKNYADNNGIKTLVLGVSGGIDSAVCFKLCEKTGLRLIGVFMPMCYEDDEGSISMEDALLTLLVDSLFKDSKAEYYDLSINDIVNAYKASEMLKFLNTDLPTEANCEQIPMFETKLGEGNLRARIRANILYEIAGTNNGIVVGTDNYDEEMLGYFTKGGDGLVDILPIVNFHKNEVYELAEVLNVPEDIVNAVPSANLWPGQTDEGELGMTYEEIRVALSVRNCKMTAEEALKIIDSDRFHEVYSKVINMIKKTEHKRNLPPSFERKGKDL
jgi:NAD+ synthase